MNTACLCLALLSCGGPSANNTRAEAYYAWIMDCLTSIATDMPQITASAEAAARVFVQDGYSIGAWGDAAFVSEFSGRAGGIMPVSSPKPHERQVSDSIVLVKPRQDRLEADLKHAAGFRSPNCVVILFAGPATREAAKSVGAQFDWIIDTHASEHAGLFRNARGKWVVPTDRAASLAAMWAWTGEFVGACTRLGKMPVMWQSLSVPGSEARAAKYRRLRFHEEKPVPVEAGKLGRDYLSEVAAAIRRIHTKEQSRIQDVAAAAAETVAAGGRFYVCGAGHATHYAPDLATDPFTFTFIKEGETGPGFKRGDLLFLVGYDEHWLEPQLGPVSREGRLEHAKLAWSLSKYGSSRIAGISRSEPIIDQHWDLGDAVVTVPGYDVKILPSSGVVAEVVLWMVAAEAATGLR